eukprot:804326-Amphidinium_carterae.1
MTASTSKAVSIVHKDCQPVALEGATGPNPAELAGSCVVYALYLLQLVHIRLLLYLRLICGTFLHGTYPLFLISRTVCRTEPCVNAV